jgi:predicted alpha/beta-hydrolase family hydrolase
MASRALKIEVPGSGKVSALRDEPQRRGPWTVVYAPGASAKLNDAFGAFAAKQLVSQGMTVVRFQFPYAEAGRNAPDRPAVLEATWRAVLDAVREPRRKICASGRSMGGRIASQVIAGGAAADALALFAYPLHPPGKPERTRDEQLPKLKLPTLFVSGTSDAFGSPEELRSASKKSKGAKTHFLEGADHGFAVKKSTGRTRDDVYAETIEVLVQWLKGLK